MFKCISLIVSSYYLSQGQLYVIGGSNGHSDELSSGERYDPHTDEWVQVPELRTNRCNAGQPPMVELNVSCPDEVVK